MNRILFICLVTLAFIVGVYKNSYAFADCNSIEDKNNSTQSSSSINNLDSIYFDISQAVFIGNSVEFPIYFKSDDIVNAIGFAFSFDETTLQYDTILVVASYFDSPIFSYNQSDSVVRFEAFSIIQPMVEDTVLLKVRFNLLGSQFCNVQFDSTWSSLNGDMCSNIVSGCQTLGLSTPSDESNLNVYPSPAQDFVHIVSPAITQVEVVDIKGSSVLKMIYPLTTNELDLNTEGLNSGLYFLKVYNEKSILVRKIVIKK